MFQKRLVDKGHVAGESQRVGLRGRMDGSVESAQCAFVGQNVREHGQVEKGVTLRCVGDDDLIAAESGSLRDDLLNHRLAANLQQCFVGSHARRFAAGDDGCGEVGHEKILPDGGELRIL